MWLGSDGGYVLPTRGPIAKELNTMLEKLLLKYGYGGLIPLYVENGVYNYYLQLEEVDENQCDLDQIKAPKVDLCAEDAEPGPNGRQARP